MSSHFVGVHRRFGSPWSDVPAGTEIVVLILGPAVGSPLAPVAQSTATIHKCDIQILGEYMILLGMMRDIDKLRERNTLSRDMQSVLNMRRRLEVKDWLAAESPWYYLSVQLPPGAPSLGPE